MVLSFQLRKLLSAGGSVGLDLRPDQVLFCHLLVQSLSFHRGVRPYTSIPHPSRGSCLTRAGCRCALGEGVPARHTADPSRLWTLKNPIFFPNCHRPRSLSPSQPTSARWRRVPPRCPYSCLPLYPPHCGRCPPSRSPVSGTFTISCPQSGRGSRSGQPRPGLPDEVVLFCGG